ncbi:predicted protein [Micromonas commoda]|uniref:Uncharacterized protein n=1 Tax=Micromonas commoda (strain RCC299 / NOUM17 / CCMP2709) TaxID=296587 RepID=C1E2S4_MICCC|nr:predicted protein [Micromonas commoda]ACO62394.1 predicted protein [Micromonas commoda]|eukprot:XP_002501136.1 predicted protein [Micromonas commoda]
MYFMTQGQRVLILEKTKKLKGVSRHSQASMFMFADVAALQAEEPGEGSPMTAKEALGPIRPISQKSPFKKALKRKPLGDITNAPAAASSFDGRPSKKHLGAHERTLPDLGLGVWDQKELLDNRAARIRQLTETAANGFQKLAPPQRESYFRRHETEDVLKAIYEHEERDAYANYFRDAVDASHNASIVANKGQPRAAAIAALALAHSVALYSALDSIVVSLGREKLHVPYTSANTFAILHRLKDAAPALWINESICAKGTHLANHTSEEFPFYRNFMMAQEKQFGNAFVVFDQARQVLECSPQPGMPHHCETALAPSMWFYFNFATTWVKRASTEYDLKVFGVSTVGGCATKVGPCRTIADMANQWGVQQAQIISIPHYDKSSGRNSGKAAQMLELTLLKMQKVFQPGQAHILRSLVRTVVYALTAWSAMGLKFASTVVYALRARSAVGLKFASTVVGALCARSAVGLESASTIVYALRARSAVGLKSASTVVGALRARSAVGLKSASTVVGALRVTIVRHGRRAPSALTSRETNAGCARRATRSERLRLSAGMSMK